MRTFVYVDGFNLYYGALKSTPWKWLDLPALQCDRPEVEAYFGYFMRHKVRAPLAQPMENQRTSR